MLVASPQPSAAQGTCSLSNGRPGTLPTDPDGNPPEVTKTGQYGEQLLCQSLTNGLKLTLNDFEIGTSAAPAKSRGLEVQAHGAEDDDFTVMGKVVIHTDKSGLYMARNDGTGLLKLQLDPESKINIAWSRGAWAHGIYLGHKGEAGEKTDGIHLESSADIDLSRSTYIYGKTGITVTTTGAAAGTTIPITVHLKGGSIRSEDTSNTNQRGIGVRVLQYAKGNVGITVEPGVMIGMEGKPLRNSGIRAEIYSKGDGNIMIEHSGHIYAGFFGIYASLSTPASGGSDVGDIKIETVAGSEIVTSGSGIVAILNSGRTGTITIIHEGKIKADRHGIQVDPRSPAKKKFDVTIRGTVMGGATEYAGVHIFKIDRAATTSRAADPTPSGVGGMIVIGPRAHVSSAHAQSADKVAIKVDAGASTATAPVTIILKEDADGFVGHVEGQILNLAAAGKSKGTAEEPPRSPLKFKTRSVSGTDTELAEGDAVYRRDKRVGVYDQVFKAELTKLADKGYWFKDVPGDWRQYSPRARLYEVMPSVLLGLVDLTPYSTRMAVPRRTTGEEIVLESSKGERMAVPGSRAGVWMRLAVRDGERMADTSTTARDVRRQSLTWDVKQTDFEAGLEVPTDDRLVLGVSAHYRQSKATVRNGGTMEANGTGVGVSLTWTDDSELYVDGQLSYTRFFDIAMTSSRHGVITSKGGGSGLALGVEVGQPMSIGGMAVTPRGGLSWSSVDMDAFDEPTTLDGAGRVTPNKEQSVQGRVGVLAELGPKDANGRLYASLDLEHEFSSKHEAMVAGTRLETEVKPTWVRLGVGGAMSLGGHDTTQLTGDAFYATAGSDNTDFGGGLSVTFRF